MADLSYDAIEIGQNFGPFKYPLSERIERYLAAVENQHPWHHGRSPWGPPVAPPTVLGNATLRFLDTVYGPVPPGTLHAKQEIHTDAALRLDRQPIGYGHFSEKYERRGRRWFVFEARWRDETGLILAHTKTTMAFPDLIAIPGEAKPSTRAEQKQPKRKGELTPITRQLSQDELDAYTEDSANSQRGQSIHTDPDVARAAGFNTTVAQGMMAADYMSELMTSVFGKDWFENAELSVAFLKPILNGDTLTANAAHRTDEVEGAVIRRNYDVWTQNQHDQVVAAGTAGSLIIPRR
jgi:acyl dehydratase